MAGNGGRRWRLDDGRRGEERSEEGPGRAEQLLSAAGEEVQEEETREVQCAEHEEEEQKEEEKIRRRRRGPIHTSVTTCHSRSNALHARYCGVVQQRRCHLFHHAHRLPASDYGGLVIQQRDGLEIQHGGKGGWGKIYRSSPTATTMM